MVRGFLAGGLGLLPRHGRPGSAGRRRALHARHALSLAGARPGAGAGRPLRHPGDHRPRGARHLDRRQRARRASISRGALEGVKDAFRHFWLTIRCSLIGTFIGIMPGLGGARRAVDGLRPRDAKRARRRGAQGLRPGRRARRARAGRGVQLQGRRRADSDHRLRRAGQHVDGDPARRLLPARPRSRSRHADQAPGGDVLAWCGPSCSPTSSRSASASCCSTASPRSPPCPATCLCR